VANSGYFKVEIMKNKLLLTGLLICGLSGSLIGQTLPVGSLDNIEDAYRRRQLLGEDTSGISFMIRPLFLTEKNAVTLSDEETGLLATDLNKSLWSKGKMAVYLLPFEWRQQINSHHPYGMNDGAMIPAKGYQTLVSGGIFARIGFLSVQFKPEYVYAQNSAFREITEAGNEVANNYYKFYNVIDMPDRFGNRAYSKFNWGQSSIRLNFGPVSAGLSNENLWWGPGIRSSLLMSNNAPGFKHITLNTTEPIRTPIGSFEAQLIGGRLEASGVPLPSGSNYKAKPDDWRYLSGIALTYQPKWIQGLYLGLDRSFIMYHNQLNGKLGNYLPLFTSVNKSDITKNAKNDEAVTRDQLISVFARWVMPESKAEIYMQYGREDHAYNDRDFIVEPEHSRAYIIGFRKLMELKGDEEYIQFGLELTQLESAGTGKIRPSGYWYSHSGVRDGYTNIGQVLGAGIGPGSNLQSLDVSWVKGLKKIGLQIERLSHNNDLMYNLGALDIRRHWVDLGLTGKFSWDYKNFIFNSSMSYVHSFNYQYILKNGQTPNFWKFDHTDVNNVQLRLGVMYRLY